MNPCICHRLEPMLQVVPQVLFAGKLFAVQAVLLDVFNASFHFTFALWVVAFTGIDSEARCRGEFMETRVQRQFPVLFAEDHQLGLVVHTFLGHRSEEHTSELQSLMRISYAVFCLKKKKKKK